MNVGVAQIFASVAVLSQPVPAEEATPLNSVETSEDGDDVDAASADVESVEPVEPAVAPKPPVPSRASVNTAALRASFESHKRDEVVSAVQRRRRLCEGFSASASDERRFAQQRNNEAAGANILEDGAGTSTGAERLALAVDTGIDGVEAGVLLSPLALVPSFSPKTPHGPTLLLAALKDGKVRAGAGYSVTVKQAVDSASVWVANACGDPDKLEASVTKTVETTLCGSVEDAYLAVCDAVVPGLAGYEASACTDPAACETAKARADRLGNACGGKVSVQSLAANTRNLAEDNKVSAELRSAIRGMEGQLGTLEAAGDALVAVSNGADVGSFLASYRVAQWSALSVRVGLDGSVDFARRQFGTRRLEPGDPGEPGTLEKLDDGSVLAWRAGPTVLLKAGRLQASTGVSAVRGVPVGSEAMFTGLQPSASVSWLVGFLDDEKISRKDPECTVGRCKVRYRQRIPKFDKDGALPAHVVLGARASMTVPITSPTFQSDGLSAATFLVHADFIVTKTLKFRLGVPVSAELVEQAENTDAEPDIPKRTVLRWTVPVFATTVLAF